MKFKITSRKLEIEVEASNKREAIQNFFALLKVFWEDWKDKIGQIALVHEPGKEPIVFRVVPSLYNLGILDEECAVANLLKVFAEPPTPEAIAEARIILYKLADDDLWMIEKARRGSS